MSDSIGFKKLRETATTILVGDYAVVADKVVYKRTQKGDPMWVITLKVTAGPYTGRSVTLNLVLSSEHVFMQKRCFKFLGLLGASDEFLDSEPSGDAVALAITGRHVIATFKEAEKEFRGEKREEVEDLKPATGGIATVSAGGGVSIGGMPAAASLPAATTVSVVTTAPAGEQIAPPEDPF